MTGALRKEAGNLQNRLHFSYLPGAMFVGLDGSKIERDTEDPSTSDPRTDLMNRGTRYASEKLKQTATYFALEHQHSRSSFRATASLCAHMIAVL
jgi:hypothetical protein